MIQHYSDHAPNERTFLAWVRTAIAVIGPRSAKNSGNETVVVALKSTRHLGSDT